MALAQPLQDAVRDDDLDAIQTCLDRVPLAEKNAILKECIALAMSQSALKATKALFSQGAALTSRALWTAIDKENLDVLQALLEAGWDINSTQFELAAIHYSVGSEAVLRWLLQHGADPNTLSERYPGRECHTPLAEAAEMSTSEAVHLLVSHGAEDPEAIFYAIGLCGQHNGTATLQALIDHGVDINYLSELWGTPLYQAIRVRDEEKMMLLLAHGADPHVKRARCGLSALDLARKKNLVRWVAIIEDASGLRGP